MVVALFFLALTSPPAPVPPGAETAVSSISIERRIEPGPAGVAPGHRHVEYTLRYDGPGTVDYELIDHEFGCAVRFVASSGEQRRRCAI